MGAESSAPRDGKTEEDAPVTAAASGGEIGPEAGTLLREGDDKPLQKNGQISSLSSLNGHSEDHTLAEVGQPDGVSVAQKEEAPETMDTTTDEVTPQVNGEKVEKESPDANGISAVEEKAAEEKPDDGSEVGFKKIFRFVGFKFTLKKDKSEEKDPVKLLTVKDKEEGEEVNGADEATKEEAATAEETVEEKAAEAEVSTAEAEVAENAESPEAETTDEAAKEEGAEKEGAEKEGAEKEEGESSPPSQEITISPFRKLFSGGLFSNLRKKASIKKTKEEEEKEAEAEAEKTEEVEADANKEKEEAKEEEEVTKEEEKAAAKEEAAPEAPTEAEDEKKQEADNQETTPEEGAAAEVVVEAELTSSQEKAKLQGSPLKKLFTGAGLKKLSTKRQKKDKKEAEAKESGDAAEQLQSSTESDEGAKADSGASTPEESGEHAVDVEATQAESSQEVEGEVVSDGEKKKEGIIAWSSFKKLVTPKKRVKRPSESEDEEKPAKSSTLSSSESAPLADKSVEEEAKEEKAAEEDKTENTEKLVSSTEEPKKKMDTSVSWEALMCMGGPKKRTRKTSDSDDDETKIEEENQQDAAETEVEAKTEAAITTSQITESEGEVASSSEVQTSSTERESAWDTLKRMVKPKNKAKAEEKAEESPEQVQSDGEAPKDESSFSLKKFFPGRRKKKADKQSTGQSSGEEDSDTPAVVPLSEYEEKTEDEKEKSTEVTEVQEKVLAEDRSPSWISATVDVAEQDELSDIPEEGENATAKSADTDTQDDDTEDIVPPPKLSGRRLSTAEVKPVAPAPPAETTAAQNPPNSESASPVNGAIAAQVSAIPANMCVALEDTPVDAAAETTEAAAPAEVIVTKTNMLLEPHAKEEVTAICTGLGTEGIADVPMEDPIPPIREDPPAVSHTVITEVTVQNKPKMPEEATASEDPLLKAQVSQIETTDLEVSVESAPMETPEIESATENSEPSMEKAGICTVYQEASEVVELTSRSENSPKAVIVDPITPTSEAVVVTRNVQVTELSVETKEEETLVAGEENTPLDGVMEVITKEVFSSMSTTVETNVTEVTEPVMSVVESNEEVCVITESIVLVAPPSAEPEVLVNAPVAVEQPDVETSKTENEEVIENAVEAQGMEIAQAVIQEAVDKVAEKPAEPSKPSTPSMTIPTPDQAIATTEAQIEITQAPIIQDTPVPLMCEKPRPIHVAMEVCDTIHLEVASSMDGTPEEDKPKREVKTATQVQVSAETITVEEVTEIKEDKDVSGELEDIKEEEENVQEVEEEKKTIHMPVQVVLQTAEVVEEQTVEEEAAVEFDSNGPVDSSAPAEGAASDSQDSESVSTQAEKKGSVNCAEVMAQVIEVIEEAVKEIEPATTEITTAS